MEKTKVQKVSEYLGVDPSALNSLGVFDPVLGVDTPLFMDPHLLRTTEIADFRGSREKVEKHYEDIIVLLVASKNHGDRPWLEARKRLVFSELKGVSIGYSSRRDDGNAIGRTLGTRLLETATDIIDFGIKDPNIFELLGLFEEGFGADRLSDMTMSIIKSDIYAFTARVAEELELKDNLVEVSMGDRLYRLPKHPNGRKPILFLPKELLRDLPVAKSWEDIDHVVATNTELRRKINAMVGGTWKNVTKKVLRNALLSDPEKLRSFLEAYKDYTGEPYDFDSDPSGVTSWLDRGREIANEYPLSLHLKDSPSLGDVSGVVRNIIQQFKKNIELNGLNKVLYVSGKPRKESYGQLLFYSIADAYCSANNIDINREPNAGSGPVDFKFSRGYDLKVSVEIKLTSNRKLIDGFSKQLPAYAESEGTERNMYLVIRVTNSEKGIDKLKELHMEAIKNGNQVPELHFINALIKLSASKR